MRAARYSGTGGPDQPRGGMPQPEGGGDRDQYPPVASPERVTHAPRSVLHNPILELIRTAWWKLLPARPQHNPQYQPSAFSSELSSLVCASCWSFPHTSMQIAASVGSLML